MRYWKSFSKKPPEIADWSRSAEREIVLLDPPLNKIVARWLSMRKGTPLADELLKRISISLETLTLAPAMGSSYDGSLDLEDPDAEMYLKPLREAGVILDRYTTPSDSPDPGWPGIQVDVDGLFRAAEEQSPTTLRYFDLDELQQAEAQVLAQTSRSPVSFHTGTILPPIIDRSTSRRVQKRRQKRRPRKRRNALEPGTSKPNISSTGPSPIASDADISTRDDDNRDVSPFDLGEPSMATISNSSISPKKRRASSSPSDTPSPKRPRTWRFYRQRKVRGKKSGCPTPKTIEPATPMCSSDVYQMEIECAITDGSSQFGDDEYDDVLAEFLVPYDEIAGDEENWTQGQG
ncbi:hypothetical protein FQN50_009481 [Emmonsiellopsis sp. PD_5]|nr:hypothetical protein FQN50_009481 [Emmonsiellopsis sp. PD_5]